MKTIHSLIYELAQHGIKLQIDGDRLKVNAPKGAMTEALATEIRTHKEALLAVLREGNLPDAPRDVPPAATQSKRVDAKEPNQLPALVPSDAPDILSEAQLALWFLDQLDGSSGEQSLGGTYNIPAGWRVRGPLDLKLLGKALDLLVHRHPILCTAYPQAEGAPLVIRIEPERLALRVVDLQRLPDPERAATSYVGSELERAFPMAQGPLFRATVLRLSSSDHILFLNQHHIISDGWSMGLLKTELTETYARFLLGYPVPSAAPELQYRDFALWQRRLRDMGALDLQLAWWKTQLADVPVRLDIPTDHPRPTHQTFRGDVVDLVFSNNLAARLVTFNETHRVTSFMTFHAAVALLLARLSGQTVICIGSPISGRHHKALESMLGMFVNTLAIPTRIQPHDTFASLVTGVREQILSCFAHQDVSLDSVVVAVQPQRDLSHSPLFQVLLSLTQENEGQGGVAGIVLEPLVFNQQTAKFELEWNFSESSSHVAGALSYNTDLFQRSTAMGLARQLAQLLDALIADPHVPWYAADLLTADERATLVHSFNDNPGQPLPVLSVLGLFQQWVQQMPEATALVFDPLDGSPEETCTYTVLDHLSANLAQMLQNRGVGLETRVGLCVSPSLARIVGVLGVLLAGGAFVPIDPEYPAERIATLVEDAGLSLILTHEQTRHVVWPEGVETLVLERKGLDGKTVLPQAVALTGLEACYLIYTSGSTGKPKGIVVPHQGLVNLVRESGRLFEVAPGARILQMASFSFDAAVWEWALALGSGGTLILAPRQGLLPGPHLHDVFARWELTHLLTSPSWLSAMDPPEHSYPRVINAGSEAGIPHVAARWSSGRRYFNAYGPTEITVVCSIMAIETAHLTYSQTRKRPLLLGRPFDKASMYVVDRWGHLAPLGAAGELWVGGVGVTRGYLNRPGLTARQFVPDCFAKEPGARLYRTGDLVRVIRLDSDQLCLDFLGRIDFQVKLRGQRIELAEIEAVLAETEGVTRAVVQLQGQGDEAFLVAYLQAEEPPADPLALAKARLPKYMVPAQVVILASFPTTSTGKLDLKALPKPCHEVRKSDVPPETQQEQALARIWAQVLNRPEKGIGREDNFFELGGHSLLAVRLANQMRAQLGVEVTVRDLFEHQSLRAQAELLGHSEPAKAAVGIPEIEASNEPEIFSEAQSSLWFLDQLEGSGGEQLLGGTYNIPAGWRMRGAFDLHALGKALELLVLRHPILRAAYPQVDGSPQVIQLAPERLALRVIDLQTLPDSEGVATRYVASEVDRAFPMAQGPLFRATVLRLAPAEHILFLNQHHIISDGWSMGVLKAELTETYARILLGQPLPAIVPKLQYRDFARWQRRLRELGALDLQLAWWKTLLSDLPVRLELPIDKPRPVHQTFHGDVVDLTFSQLFADRLFAFNTTHRVTSFMTFHAVVALLLARLSGQTVICIGSPTSGRHHKALETMLGMFVNTLAIPTRIQPYDTFASLIASVRDQILLCFAHQDVGLDRVVEAVQPQRDLTHPPLFQVLLSLVREDEGQGGVAGVDLEPLHFNQQTAKFELEWNFSESLSRVGGALTYNTDLFERSTALRLSRQLTHLLDELIADPYLPWHAANLLTTEEREALIHGFNDNPRQPFPATTVLSLFQQWVQRTPDATALVFDPLDGNPVESCTYAALAQQSASLARSLQDRGVGLETRVGLCLPPSLERILGVLGVISAGGAYVPIDPDYPMDRINAIVEDASLSLVLTHPLAADLSWPEGVEILALNRQALDQDMRPPQAVPFSGQEAAYLIYTSGSTGKPKGIVVPHQGLVNLVHQGIPLLDFTPDSRILQMASFSFDVSVLEWAGSLSSGATLILAPRQSLLPSPHLHDVFARWQLSHLLTSPSWLSAMEPPPHAYPRMVVVAGEAGIPHVTARWLVGRRHVNAYGPTEITVVCSMLNIEDAHLAFSQAFKRPLLLGGPFAHVQKYVIDRWGQPVPFGVAGELWVGGIGVTRGYHNRPGLTARQFVPDCFGPEAGSRIYRTGDLVRMVRLTSGAVCLDFIGRIDFQVKLRGYRIELAEIEAVLSETEGVSRAVVLLQGSGESAFLVAYLQSEVDLPDPLALAKARLPQYMVPAQVIVLPHFPMTTVGKLDLKALPKPTYAARTTYAPPETENERALAQIWAEVLERSAEGIGREDSFFDLGGHSLLAVRLANQLRAQFGAEVTVRELFERPSLQAQAELLSLGGQPSSGVELPEIVVVDGPDVLSEAQSAMWFLDQIEGSGGEQTLGGTYNIPAGWRARGPFDLAAMAQALEQLVRKHPILRAAYPAREGLPEVIQLDPARLALKVVDVSALPDPEAAANNYVNAELNHAFPLAQGPLFRATVLRLTSTHQILFINQHHIIADGWSLGLLKTELTETYLRLLSGQPLPLVVPQLQYRDFAHWQRRLRDLGALDQQLAWWKTQLEEVPARLDLPVDHPRPIHQTFNGKRVEVGFADQLGPQVQTFNTRHRVTHFMTLHAALALLLSRLSGQSVICLGSPTSGRHHKALEPMLGMFVNTLAIPTRIQSADTFSSLVASVRDQILGCFANQDVSLDRVVEVVQPHRDLSYSPLFQVLLSVTQERPAEETVTSLILEPLEYEVQAVKFELEWSIVAFGNQLAGSLGYNTDLFSSQTASRLARQLAQLLDDLVTNPHLPCHAANLLTAEERKAIVEDLNAHPQRPLPATTVLTLLQEWAQKTPEATALLFDPLDGGPLQTLSYAALMRESSLLARILQNNGVGLESRVGLCLPPSLERMVGMLGVLSAGAAYVPIDAEYPAERIATIVDDAGLSLVLTHPETALLAWPQDATRLTVDRAALSDGVGKARSIAFSGMEAAYLIYTSGSTGKPKGITVPHLGIVNMVREAASLLEVTPDSRLLQLASFSFDASVLEWAVTLGSGATLILAPRQRLLPGPHLYEVFARWQLSHLSTSPAWLSAMEPPTHAYPRVVFAGGEAGNPHVSARWLDGRLQINAYGPSEITVVCSMLRVDPSHLAYSFAFKRPLLLAGPFDHVQLYVVDRWGQPVPFGVTGELWVGGVGLSRGYHQRPALTARQFVPNPFDPNGGSRLYRSGDLVRWVQLDSGQKCLDFMGRIDFQVKLRGQRLELAEIEAVLAETAGVSQALVRLQGSGDAAALVAYLQSEVELADPLALAKARLPQYMVPAHVVVVPRFPLTPSGKVDLKALPLPNVSGQKQAQPPATDTERLLAAIWAQILGCAVDAIGRDDNFFQLGGHSLMVVRLANQIRAQFGMEVEVRALFARPTLRAQAEAIDTGLSAVALPEPTPRSNPERRLSHAQNTLWFLDQLEGSGGDGRLGGTYNIPSGWVVGGLLDVSALDRTFADVLQQFPILRSVYPSIHGKPSVELLPPEAFALRVLDLRGLADADIALNAFAHAEQHHSFPLGTGPLFRATLLWLDTARFALVINQHHIIADGWSMGLLRDTLLQQYAAHLRGTPLVLPSPELDYWDYAQWQHELGQAGLLDRQLAWWKQTLAPVPTRLEFPTDKPRPKVQTFRGDSTPIHLDRQLSDALGQLELRLGLTPFMSWHALTALLLARHSGQNCVCIGSPVAGRSHARLEPIYGMFVSMLPVAHAIDPHDSLESLLTQTRDRVLACFAHAEVPFDRIVETAVQQRDLSHPPLFQVLLSVMNLPVTDQLAGQIDLEPLSFGDDQTKFELGFTFIEDAEGRGGSLQYNTDLFERDAMVRLARRLEFLVAEVVRDAQQPCGRVSLLASEQDRQLLEQLNQVPYTAFGPLTVAEQLRGWAHSQPNSPALCFTRADGSEQTLSYRDLDELSNRLAHQLHQRGLGLGSRIGICIPPALERMVAVIAIHKAGGLYVPLDPEYPSERLHFMVEDARLDGIFSHPDTANLVWPADVTPQVLELSTLAQLPPAASQPPIPAVAPDHSAYMIYTSGSTGAPKGVLMPHLGLNHIVAQLRQPLGIGPQTRFLQVASFNFDVSVFEWALALSSGGCLVLVPRADLLPGPETLSRLQTWRISHIAPTPAWLSAVVWDETALLAPPVFPHVVISAGEACSPQLAERWAQGRRFVNGYGPTENAILTTVADIDDPVLDACKARQRGIPLGRPFGKVTAYVLDRRGERVPPGVAGELCSGGVGLARGYWGRPTLTAERFVPDPFSAEPGARLYRTGDLVRLTELGDAQTLDYLGRIDHQVKLRGFRIELGEIEAALLAEDQVQEAVALIHTSATGNRFLLAFVGGSCESDSSREAIRTRLRSRLPEYMVPAHLVWLAQFPTSGAGKVDRGRLASQVEALLAHRGDTWIAPRTLTEQQLAAIWSNLLGLSPIGANQDFFQLGGHSLLAVRLADEIHQHFGQKLPVSALFLHATLEAQAQWLDQKTHQDGPLVTLQPGHGQPWFFVHPIGGQVHWYLPLARLLQPNPCYALQAQGLSDGPPPASLDQMVQDYVAAVQHTQPQGPYRLFGWSAGGTLALAMARELESRQEHPVEVVLLDAYRFPAKTETNLRAEVLQFLSDLQAGQPRHAPQTYLEALADVNTPEQAWIALEQAQLLPEGWSSAHLQRFHAVTHAIETAISGFQVPTLRGRIRHYQASANHARTPGWESLPQLETTLLQGDHYSLLTPAMAPVLAQHLRSDPTP